MLLSIKITLFYGVFHLIERYLFNDWQFAAFLSVLVFIDTLTGFWKHFKLETISSKGFARTITKLMVYSMFLIVTHIMSSFTINGMPNVVFQWFPQAAYTVLIIREALSVIENLNIIMPGIIPAWMVNKLKNIGNNGK